MPVTEFSTHTALTVSMAGVEYPVLLDNHGTFHVEIGEMTLMSGSFDGLQKQVTQARQMTRFLLPFTDLRSSHQRSGAVTGFHARSGSLLIRWEDGTTSALRAHELSQSMPRLSAADEAELDELIAARTAAVKALDGFFNARKWPRGIRIAAETEMQRQAGLNTEMEK